MRIKCPECGAEKVVPDDFPVRPFCSPRCKLLDLGHWLNEEHRLIDQAENGGQLSEPSAELTVDLDRYQIPEA